MSKILVVYDFDWSFVDQDTDRWIFEVLSTKLRRKWEDRNDAINKDQCCPDVSHVTMGELAAEGFTQKQILEALRVLPLHPAQKRAVLGLRERHANVEFICLSNSNIVYITTVLEKHGLTDLFAKIITNPAEWSKEDPNRLNIGRRVTIDGPQHDCKVGCRPNMCKGEELDAYVRANGGWEKYEKIVYVGDGGNDYCPMLKMRQGDWGLVRKGYGLDRKLQKEGGKAGLKVDVKMWDQAWQIEEYFQTL